MRTGYIITLISALALSWAAAAQVPQKELAGYACAHYDWNVLHYPGSHDGMDRFYDKLDQLLLFDGGGVNIWHVGGSHVQADFFSNRMRTNLLSIQDGLYGVRGDLFPYSLASTNYNKNYSCECYGSWTTASNLQSDNNTCEIGLAGRSAKTSDPSTSVSLALNTSDDAVRWQFTSLYVLGYGSSEDVYPYITESGRDYLGTKTDAGWIINLDSVHESVQVRFNIPSGGSFVLTGLIPDFQGPGIRYFSSGVNGAAVPSWLRCSRLQTELGAIHPDLAIFAIGVNDAAVPWGSFNKKKFKSEYRQVIEMLRNVNPDCAFLFVTNNDIFKYGTANKNSTLVQEAFYELAEEFDGCVWDMFDIMGNLGSIEQWRDTGLAASDLIHFTRTGYELMGDMLYNAILDDYMSVKIE